MEHAATGRRRRKGDAAKLGAEVEVPLRRIASWGDFGDPWRLTLVSTDPIEGVWIDDEGDGFHFGAAVAAQDGQNLIDLGQHDGPQRG